MKLLAIDPGPSRSALVGYDTEARHVLEKEIMGNPEALHQAEVGHRFYDLLVVEVPHSTHGQPAGRDLLSTCVWAGRFLQQWARSGGEVQEVSRDWVKGQLCRAIGMGDKNVRAALIDRFGGQEKAIGNKRCRKCKGKGWFGAGRPECPECHGSGWRHPPGPLVDFYDDLWAALAVAVTIGDQRERGTA